jgi:hypothetical protein
MPTTGRKEQTRQGQRAKKNTNKDQNISLGLSITIPDIISFLEINPVTKHSYTTARCITSTSSFIEKDESNNSVLKKMCIDVPCILTVHLKNPKILNISTPSKPLPAQT